MPAISETVSLLPSRSTPDMATNKGVVEVKVNVKVGPRRRTEIRAKLTKMSGRNRPPAAKIRDPILVQWPYSRNIGDNNQKNNAVVPKSIMVPVRLPP